MSAPYFLGTYKQKDRTYLNKLHKKYTASNKNLHHGAAKLVSEICYDRGDLDNDLFNEIQDIIFSSIAEQAIEMATNPKRKFPRGECNEACYLYSIKEVESFMRYFNSYNGDIHNLHFGIVYDNYGQFFCYEVATIRNYTAYKNRFLSNETITLY